MEELKSGALFCQLVDVLHQGKIIMGKINWKAKSEQEFSLNFNLLNSGF
jgi:RP/EB family microtubule-associated protein